MSTFYPNSDAFASQYARIPTLADEIREDEATLEKVEGIISRNRRALTRSHNATRAQSLTNLRVDLIVSLYELHKAEAAYDRAHDDAMSDPTGQDLDAFYDD